MESTHPASRAAFAAIGLRRNSDRAIAKAIIEKDRASRSATLPVRSSAVLILGCAELQSLVGRDSAPCGCGFDNPPSGLIRRPHACSVILAVQFVSTGVLLKARPKRGGGRSPLVSLARRD